MIKVLYLIRVYFKLFKLKILSIPTVSFCKNCGRNVRDYSAPDDVWEKIKPQIKLGDTLCYECFSDACEKKGIPTIWKLEKI